jgi:hypothetical protein
MLNRNLLGMPAARAGHTESIDRLMNHISALTSSSREDAMFSETYSRPSLPNYEADPKRAEAVRPAPSEGLSHIEPWLALGVVALGAWASWGVTQWLLAAWQIQ